MSKQPAYLIIHKVAPYNDEFYDDYTTDSASANPAALFTTRQEAEAHAQHLTRQALKGADQHDLLLGEDASTLLYNVTDEAPDIDHAENLQPLLACLADGQSLPRDLTDTQADQLISALNLKLFYVLEAELEPAQVQEAQTILQTTPERPYLSPDYDDESGEPTYHSGGDPTAERLERVTQLFGRHYATEESY